MKSLEIAIFLHKELCGNDVIIKTFLLWQNLLLIRLFLLKNIRLKIYRC